MPTPRCFIAKRDAPTDDANGERILGETRWRTQNCVALSPRPKSQTRPSSCARWDHGSTSSMALLPGWGAAGRVRRALATGERRRGEAGLRRAREGWLSEARPWPAQRGRPATGSGRRGQMRPRRGEAGPWSARWEAAGGREALLLRLVGVGRRGAARRACGGRRRGRNERAWGCARGRRSDRAEEEGDATGRVCGGRARARRGACSAFAFVVGEDNVWVAWPFVVRYPNRWMGIMFGLSLLEIALVPKILQNFSYSPSHRTLDVCMEY